MPPPSRVPQELDDEALRRATDFVARQLKPTRDEIETARVDEKAPFLASCRTVDGVFGDALNGLKDAIRSVEETISAHLNAQLEEMEPRPDVSAADLTRTRSAHGSIASLRTDVGFEITDLRSAVTHVWKHAGLGRDRQGDPPLHQVARARRLRAEVALGDVHESGIRFFIRRRAQTR